MLGNMGRRKLSGVSRLDGNSGHYHLNGLEVLSL